MSGRNQENRAAANEAQASGPDNQVRCADNLPFMRALEGGVCDLVYADPPFNSNRTVGSFGGSSPAFSDRHWRGVGGYLEFLRPRLAEMCRLLSKRGSLYVHVDWHSVHYVKVMLDELLGPDRFLNEIIWSYRSGGRPARWFARKHDTLLLYAKKPGAHTFNRLRGGSYRTLDLRTSEDGRPYKSTRRGPIRFHPEGPALSDVWEIPFLSTVSSERTGYPTQKPEALLERVIRASSNEGDTVLDCCMGSGTSGIACLNTGRNFIGIEKDQAIFKEGEFSDAL